MPLPKYYEAISLPAYRNAPVEKRQEMNQQYWDAYLKENPDDGWGKEQAKDSTQSLRIAREVEDAAPVARRALEVQRELLNSRVQLRNRDAGGAWQSAEEREQFVATREKELAPKQESIKKTLSLFDPEVEKEMQPTWGALQKFALEGGIFGERSVRSSADSGSTGSALGGMNSPGSTAAQKRYESLRNTISSDFNLKPEEVDDLVKHRMGLQEDSVSRDAAGGLHIKDELLARGNQDIQQAIVRSNLPDRIKSNLSIEAPFRIAAFKSGVVETTKKQHPELAATIDWSGDVEKDYAAINRRLNETRKSQFGAGTGQYFAKRSGQVFNAVGLFADKVTEPLLNRESNISKAGDIIADQADSQASINQLSNYINQEKVRIWGTDAATIGAGVASGIESIAIGAVTGGGGNALISADRIAKAGKAGKVLWSGAQRALNTAPIASIYGLEQGLETYERTGNAGLSVLSAAIEGGVTTVFGAVKLGGTEDIGQRLVSPAVRQQVAKSVAKSWGLFAADVGKTVTGEQLEEMTISALNDLYVESQINPGLTVSDMKKNLYDTAVATLFASGPIGAVGAAREQGSNLIKPTHEQTDNELHERADSLAKAAAKENLPSAEAAGGTDQTSGDTGVAPSEQMSRSEFEAAVIDRRAELTDSEEDQAERAELERPIEEIAAGRGVEIVEDSEADLPPPEGFTPTGSVIDPETGLVLDEKVQEGLAGSESAKENLSTPPASGPTAEELPVSNTSSDSVAPKAREVIAKFLTPEAQALPPESFLQARTAAPEQVKLQNGIAKMYADLPDNDGSNPEVVTAYENLTTEVVEQHKAMLDTGLEIELVSDNPYITAKEMVDDVKRGKLKVQKTDAQTFGPSSAAFDANSHPMLRDSGAKDAKGQPMLVNDVFRAVHDYIAHAAFGSTFGPIGEEAAWRAHLATIKDPLARRALTTETRGQNSWVNYRDEMLRDGKPVKKGEPGYVAPKDRPFAPQKFALLPEEAMQELRTDSAPSTKKNLLEAPIEEIAQEAYNNPEDPVAAAMLVFAAAGTRPASLPGQQAAPSTPGKLVQGELFQNPESTGDPAASKLVQSYKGSPPKGATRALIDYAGEPLLADLGDLPAHTVRDIKEADQIIQEKTGKNGKAKLGRVGFNAFLSKLWKRHHRGKSPGWHNFQSRRDIREMGKILSFEIAHALSKDGSGVDWYRAKIDGMYSILAKEYPELGEDSEGRFLFSIILAVTSNGQTVVENLRDSIRIYEEIRGTSSLPKAVKTSRSERNAAVQKAFRQINSLLLDNSWQSVKEQLLSPMTVSELKEKYGQEITGELADHTVIGAMLVGPKIGSFWGNLNGHYASVTMDLWFTRTMNRLSGDTATIDASKFGDTLRKLQVFPDLPIDVKADIKKYLKDLDNSEKSWVNVPSDIREKVEHLYNFSKKSYSQYASSGFTDRSDFNKTVQKIIKELDGGEDTPDNGSHRKWMRSVVAAAQEQLQKAGVNITNADLQAILWFHEKDLYTRFGATSNRGERNDYTSAAEKLTGKTGGTATGTSDSEGQSNGGEAGQSRSEQLTLFQDEEGPKGTYTPKAAAKAAGVSRAVLQLLEGKSDTTTGIHEAGHAIEDFLEEIGEGDKAAALRKWAEDNGKTDWREQREYIARGFERYVVNGVKTGVEAVDKAFARIAEIMINIYKGIKGSSIDIDIPPHIEKIFNDLLSRGSAQEAAGQKPTTIPVDVKKTPAKKSAAKPAPQVKKAKKKLPSRIRPTEEVDDFGIRKVVTDAIRKEHGMPGSELKVSMTDQEAWDEALLRIARADAYDKATPEQQRKMPRPPLVGSRLVDDLIDNPRNSDKVEKALLAHEGLRLERAVEKSRVATEKLPEGATAAERASAQNELNNAIDDLQQLLDVIRVQGSRAGLALQAMKLVVSRQFELSRMLSDAAAAKNSGSRIKKDLTAEEVKDIKKLSDEIKKMVKEREALDDKLAESERKLQEKELEIQILKSIKKESATPRKSPERKSMTERAVSIKQSAKDKLAALGYGRKVLDQSQEIPESTPYEVYNSKTGEVVWSGTYGQRDSARRVRDSRDTKYGSNIFKARLADSKTLRQSPELPTEALEAFAELVAALRIEGKTEKEIEKELIDDYGDIILDNTDKIFSSAGEAIKKVAAGSRKKSPQELASLLDPDKELSNRMVFNMVIGFLKEPHNLRGDAVLDAVTKLLNDNGMTVTRTEVSDAYTSYGKAKFPSKDELLKEARELRRIELIKRQIDVVRAGMLPEKTGQQRDTATAEVRALEKELQDAKRAAKLDHSYTETQQKGYLDSLKSRLTNDIEDINIAISKNERINKTRRTPEYDQELLDLKAKKESAQKRYDDHFGVNRKALTDHQRIEATLRILDKQIAEEEQMERDGILTRPKVSPKTPQTAEILARRARLDQLRALRRQAREAANPAKTEAQRATDRLRKGVEKSIERFDYFLTNGRFPPKSDGTTYSREDFPAELLQLRNDMREAVAALRAEDRQKGTREERMVKATIRTLEKTVEDLQRRIDQKDFSKKEKIETSDSRVLGLRETVKLMRSVLSDMSRVGEVIKTPEEKREESIIKAKEKRLKEIKQRIEDRDFSDPIKRDPLITKRIAALDATIQEAKNEFADMKRQWVLSNKSLGGKAWYYTKGILQLRKILVLGAELGVVGRQGNIFTITGLVWNPARAARVINKAFRAFSRQEELEIYNAMMEDPLAMWFPTLEKKGGWKLHNPHDEGYGNKEDLPDPELLNKLAKLRGIGIAAEAILGVERFTRVFLNAARIEMLRSFVGTSRNGEPTLEEMKVYSNAVMNATGRGSFRDQRMDTGVALGNTLTISTRWLVSRAKMATFEPLWTTRAEFGGTAKARARVAWEIYGKTLLARTLLTYAIVAATKFSLDDDEEEEEIEFNPLSSKFGAIKYKGATIDISGGIRQHVNIIARLARGEKVTLSGEIIKIRGEGSNRFKGTTDDEIWNFIRNRTNVNVGFALDVISGEFYGGEPVGVGNSAAKLVAPIMVGDTIALFKEYGPVEAAVLWNAMFFGATVSPPRKPKESGSTTGPMKLKLDLDLDLKLKP